MLKNYLLIALRQFRKNKGYSYLNIIGLAVGIACAGLIFLWVEDEMTFDNIYTKKEQLYITKVSAKVDMGIFTHQSTPGPLAPSLHQQLTGIENTCRVTEDKTPVLFNMDDKAVYAAGFYAEPSLFSMFGFPFLQGNPSTAFSQLYSMVVTEKTARKFFGNQSSVIGKTVRMDNKQDYVITGVIKDLPDNSSLQFEWLAPYQIFEQANPWIKKWSNFGITTYVELKKGVDPAILNRQLNDPRYDFTLGKKDAQPSSTHIYLFGMKDWRLHEEFENGKPTGGGRIQFVKLFSTIAWIILFIACINFMNLATARSEHRSREVGVRKVLGAGKGSLIGQFMGEALFMAFLAMLAAFLLISLLMPAFNNLVQKNLTPGWDHPLHWLAMILLTLICGLIAGSYPALYLSAFNPVFVLKGLKTKAGSATAIRQGLVVVQFTVCIVLVIGTIIIYQQINHVKNRDLGFNKDQLIQLEVHGAMTKNFPVIRQEFLQLGGITNAALADHTTLNDGNNTTGITWKGKDPANEVLISQRLISPEYMQTLGMHITEGSDFGPGNIQDMENMTKQGPDSSESFNVIITNSLAQILGPGSAVGKTLDYNGNRGLFHLHVQGVIKDYVYGDVYAQQSTPVIFYCIPQYSSLMYVRTAAGTDPGKILSGMEKILKKYNPGYPFEYTFVDEQFNNMFESEMLISKLSRVFASLAIFISCLGLFGLAAYTAERRTKEIGIRKVLGASTAEVTRLLSIDFLKLVIVACVVAFPVAWMVMQHWLKDYAYRIDLSIWVFVTAGILAIIIALLTVSFQAVKAAMVNPVKSLKAE